MSADNIILNSCQYTPVYFIESPGVSQARSYVITPNNQCVDKPVSENLKRFYESSGKLESNLNIVESAPKPKLIRKQENNIVGNNLKLASFLLPKCETKNEITKSIITPVNNVVLKPVYIANNISVNNVNTPSQVPTLDINSKLVNLKGLPNIVRSQNGKILPKIKPKENTVTNKQKHNSVQLVKLGETYHSLNQLNNDQMKIVNHALKIFSTPQTGALEPAYDPDTNTKFIYKVVSQKDFAVADKNKVNKQIIPEIKKESVKVENSDYIEEEPKTQIETKVTRSGRVVKLPKNIIVDDSPTKPKRRITPIVSCLQCTSKFSSSQRLHRHYENHPSHLPTNPHNNLFHCLIAIVSASPESDRAGILINQLEQFIDKLKSCIPCLLKTDDITMDKSNLINGDISKIFGLNPGKYNLNTDALSCEKDNDGYCTHNPRPPTVVSTDSIKPQILLLENNDNGLVKSPNNILKTNYLERRPTILRKVECRKQKLELSSHIINNGKKIKLSQDNDTNSNNLGIDDIVALLSDAAKTENIMESKSDDNIALNNHKEAEINPVLEKNITKPHIQFHSTHFDIRSSPIKPSSTVFRKFQIRPEKMANYEIEIIRPLHLNQLATDNNKRMDNNLDTQEIFKESNMTSKEIEHLNYDTSHKNWTCEEPSNFMNPTDLMNNDTESFLKSNSLIQPSLLHAKDNLKVGNNVTNQTDYMKTNILMESELLLAQENPKVTDIVTDRAHDFMKSNILIEPALMHAQDNCSVSDKVTGSNDFIKSNIILESSLLHSQEEAKIANTFTEQPHSFMTSHPYMEPSLTHTNNINKVTGENSEIDIDLPTSQGQSIMSFLESLGNELAYTETENRNNSVDFQLDLFSFNNS